MHPVEIRNTTKRPLRVPLPGGKKLFLGRAGKGQISAGALDHPPLKELLDSGAVEVVEGGGGKNTGRDHLPKAGPTPQTGGGGGGGVRHSGDR